MADLRNVPVVRLLYSCRLHRHRMGVPFCAEESRLENMLLTPGPGPSPLLSRLGLDRFVKDIWAVADQALIAASNFATMIFVARALKLELFGRFTLVYSALLFANIFQVALITQPHNV